MTFYPTLYGVYATGFLIAGICFFKIWRRERAVLIALVGTSFVLLALNYFLLGVMHGEENDTWIYMIRFAAFSLIIIGIVLSNLQRNR